MIIVVGVGNIYINESLFESRISPLREALSLKIEEVKKLVLDIKKTLKTLLDKYGSAVTSVDKSNEKGLNFCKRLGFIVLNEEKGKILLRCDRSKYV